MKKDYFREYLQDAIEAYDLAATPQPPVIHPEDMELRALTDNRHTLLNFSIDIKNMVNKFLMELSANHGKRRVERFIQWTIEGYLERYSYAHRQQLVSDRRRLTRIFTIYRRGND